MSTAETRAKQSVDADLAAWQFSLRGLLLFVTCVSLLMATGVVFAGILLPLSVVGVVQVGMLLSADWLIRPANRRVLAFLTAASWSIVGSALLIIGGLMAYEALCGEVSGLVGSFLAVFLGAAGLSGYCMARLRWHQLAPKPMSRN